MDCRIAAASTDIAEAQLLTVGWDVKRRLGRAPHHQPVSIPLRQPKSPPPRRVLRYLSLFQQVGAAGVALRVRDRFSG